MHLSLSQTSVLIKTVTCLTVVMTLFSADVLVTMKDFPSTVVVEAESVVEAILVEPDSVVKALSVLDEESISEEVIIVEEDPDFTSDMLPDLDTVVLYSDLLLDPGAVFEEDSEAEM